MLTPEDKIEILKTLHAKEALKKDRAIEDFIPSVIQKEILLAEEKIVLIIGANRSGKSEVLGIDSQIRATGIIPDCLKDEYPLEFCVHGNYCVSAITYTLSHGITEEKIKKFMPKRLNDGFNKEFREQKLKCGCKFIYKSADAGRERYQGYSFNYTAMDEEHPKDVYDEVYMRGVDCRGIIRKGFTPVMGMTWAHSDLYKKAKRYISTINKHGLKEDIGIIHTPEEINLLKERILVIQDNPSPEADPNIIVFQMTIYDNKFLPDIEIYNTEVKWKDDPADYNARVLGRFGKITGRNVFPTNLILTKQRECPSTFLQGDFDDNGKFYKNIKGRLFIFKDLQQLTNQQFVIGGDVAQGLEEGDYNCAQVLHHHSGEQWAKWHGKVSPDEFARILYHMGKFFNNALLAPEINFHGYAVINWLRDRYNNLFTEYDIIEQATRVSPARTRKRYGWRTDAKTKPIMIHELAEAIKENRIKINDVQTYDELLSFIYDKDGKMNAQKGCFDDHVTALAIAHQVLKRKPLIIPNLMPIPERRDELTGY